MAAVSSERYARSAHRARANVVLPVPEGPKSTAAAPVSGSPTAQACTITRSSRRLVTASRVIIGLSRSIRVARSEPNSWLSSARSARRSWSPSRSSVTVSSGAETGWEGRVRQLSQASSTASARASAPEPAQTSSTATSRASRRTCGRSPTLEPRTRGSVEPADHRGEETFMEFKDYVRIVLAHWVGVLVLIVAGVAGAVAYNVTQPQVYQATATGLVTAGKSQDSSDATINDSLAQSRVTSYVAVATSSRVAERVLRDPAIKKLDDIPDSAGALVGDITVAHADDTVVITIDARGSSPENAQALADAWVRSLAAEVLTIESGGSADTTSTPNGLHLAVFSSAAPGS